MFNINDMLPAFEVEKQEGTVLRTQRRYVLDKELSTPEKKRYKMVDEQVEEPAGYLVFFPKGHAVHVSEVELKRLGFDRNPRLVHMETGEEMEAPNFALKRNAEHRAGKIELALE